MIVRGANIYPAEVATAAVITVRVKAKAPGTVSLPPELQADQH
jgi:hypothetical protein